MPGSITSVVNVGTKRETRTPKNGSVAGKRQSDLFLGSFGATALAERVSHSIQGSLMDCYTLGGGERLSWG